MQDTLEGVQVGEVTTGVAYIPQETVIFHISMISCDGIPISVMAAGGEVTYTASIQGGDFHAALVALDQRLSSHQETHPGHKMVEICGLEVIELMNLLLEIEGLKPVDEDDFDFADTLFWLSNPTLAKQMGHMVS